MASALADRAGKDGDVWAVPVGIRDVLRHRLSSLSPASRDVLPVAAVLGASVDVELLAEVTRLPEEEVAAALDDAVAEGLLVESGSSWSGSYDFANDLVREALRSTLGGFRLRALHLGTAEALMSRPGRRPNAAIAAHLRAAGPAADPLEAARYSLPRRTSSARSMPGTRPSSTPRRRCGCSRAPSRPAHERMPRSGRGCSD